MNETDNILLQLEQSCSLADDADFGPYSEAIEFLRQHPSPEVLPRMLRCLRDADAGEIQYELVEACEAYPSEDYVPAFLFALPLLRATAPYWGRLMLQSILNSPDCVRLLIAQAPHASDSIRTQLRDWVFEITADSPQYQRILHELDGNA